MRSKRWQLVAPHLNAPTDSKRPMFLSSHVHSVSIVYIVGPQQPVRSSYQGWRQIFTQSCVCNFHSKWNDRCSSFSSCCCSAAFVAAVAAAVACILMVYPGVRWSSQCCHCYQNAISVQLT